MRSPLLLLALLSLSVSAGACAAPSDAADDEIAEQSESDLSASSLIGKSYTVEGNFTIRDRPSMTNRSPKETPLGDGGAQITITRSFKGGVSGFIGNHHDKFGADVTITYRNANGAKRVVTADDRDFEPEQRGYGPFVDVVNVGNVSLGVVISDFGRRRLFQVEINVPAPNGKEILFRPKSIVGPT